MLWRNSSYLPKYVSSFFVSIGEKRIQAWPPATKCIANFFFFGWWSAKKRGRPPKNAKSNQLVRLYKSVVLLFQSWLTLLSWSLLLHKRLSNDIQRAEEYASEYYIEENTMTGEQKGMRVWPAIRFPTTLNLESLSGQHMRKKVKSNLILFLLRKKIRIYRIMFDFFCLCHIILLW